MYCSTGELILIPHAGAVDMSVGTSCVTRFMTNMVGRERGEGFNQSLMLREMNKKQ